MSGGRRGGGRTSFFLSFFSLYLRRVKNLFPPLIHPELYVSFYTRTLHGPAILSRMGIKRQLRQGNSAGISPC